MISTSVKQLIAWPIAFGLSGGFFLGCFEALKYLPSKPSAHQQASLHTEDDTHTTHKTEHTSEALTEKSHSIDHQESIPRSKRHAAQNDHHSHDATADHRAKTLHASPETPHETKTH
jgi:hypothetical protein